MIFAGAEAVLARASGAAAAITVVLYLAWFMPFFQSFFAGREEFARIVFYTLYGSLVLPAAAVLGTRADVRRVVLPCAIGAVICLAVTPLHSIGLVTRAYIIAVLMGGATVVLMLGSAPRAVLQLTAAVTALNGLLCFVDLLFANGFTNTVGRAAGLAINPNSAAAAILFGAAASYRAVPPRLQLSFLALIGGSLAVTLSRSTLLTAAAALVVPCGVELVQRLRAQQPLMTRCHGLRPASVLVFVMIGWVALATVTNQRFAPVVQAMISDSFAFANALEEAHESVAVAARTEAAASAAPAATPVASNEPPAVSSDPPSSTSAATPGSETTPADEAAVNASAPAQPGAPPSDASQIAALDERLSHEGSRNSISARTLFLERALIAYRNSGLFGIGLDKAQPLAPHNTYVLFALAYGYLGWIVPLVLVALGLYAARDVRDLPLPIAVAGMMVFSHDILVTPSLVLPIAIGIGGMLAGERREAGRNAYRSIASAAVAAVILFVLGCLTIVRFVPSLTVEPLNAGMINPFRGAYAMRLPPQTYPGVFVPAAEERSGEGATFLRDGLRLLTRVDWKPGVAPAVEAGEYVVHDGGLVFSPPDGSDPRAGGHTFELGLPHQVGAPFYALLLALAGWCAAVLLLFAGRTASSVRSPLRSLMGAGTSDRLPIRMHR